MVSVLSKPEDPRSRGAFAAGLSGNTGEGWNSSSQAEGEFPPSSTFLFYPSPPQVG